LQKRYKRYKDIYWNATNGFREYSSATSESSSQKRQLPQIPLYRGTSQTDISHGRFCLSLYSVYGHFGSKTFRQQDTSTAEEYYRSVRTLRQHCRCVLRTLRQCSRSVSWCSSMCIHPVSASVASDDLMLSLYFVFVLYL